MATQVCTQRYFSGGSGGTALGIIAAALFQLSLSLVANPAAAQTCFIDQTSTRTGTRITIDLQSGCSSQEVETAFGAAALYWADFLYSPVPITVEANFQPLYCTPNSAVLGSAGPTTALRGFAGAPDSGVFYPIALANSFAGEDTNSSISDITMSYNSDIGTTGCLESKSWFFDDGTSTNVPSNRVDLYGTIQHELGHGLGFLSYYTAAGNFVTDDPAVTAFVGYTDSYSQYLFSESQGQGIDSLSAANRQSTFISNGGMTWSGAAVDNLAGTLSAGTNNDNVRMYAPNPYEGGSSVSHFDTVVEPGELMEPSKLPRDQTNFTLTRNLFRDIGWKTLPDPPSIASTGVTSDSVTVSVTAPNQTGGSAILNYTVTCGNVSETSASSTITVSGLAAGTAYSCSGVATTGIGTSDASATITATTDSGGPPPPTLAEALDAPSLTWTTGGDANWAGQTALFHALDDNDDAAQSGEITHNQSSYIETTVSGPGAIDFYWSVSSEAGYDFLSFYVDGALIERISGEVYWTQVAHDIAGEGDHTLRWVFSMDVNTSNGVDTGWVDLVTWGEAQTPNAPTLISVETEQTTSLTGSATVSFSPAETGPVADSYVATCTPQSASRQVSSQVVLSGDVPTAEEFAALTSRPSKAETDALKQLHQAETFRDSGARCGTDAINSRNSNIPRTMADCTNSLTVIKSSYEAPTDGTYVIPIVWHVIYKTDTAQTGLLSAADIADQIDALNEDYAGFLGAGVDTKIQFVLEDIKYYENDAAYDDLSSAAYDLKDQNKVDGTRFLNVFSNDARGNLGYAWFPVWGVGTSGDFVTMNAAYVGGRSNGAGVFDEGRTLVHEIGHYLGLIHTFGDDEACGGNTYSSSDLIVDTPEQKFADYSQASSDCGVTSALNNFMNYSYDDLMYTFTEEQTNRMICSLQNYRSAAYELVSDGPTAVTVTATGTTSPIVVPDLVAGATYQCSVAAVAGTQESASSSSGTIMAGDHDGDGVLDYDDAFPNDPTETTDTDGEGLGDNLEGTLGTDINNPDTDGDGYTDYEEYVDGTDPLDDGDPGSGGLPIWLLYQATQ